MYNSKQHHPNTHTRKARNTMHVLSTTQITHTHRKKNERKSRYGLEKQSEKGIT